MGRRFGWAWCLDLKEDVLGWDKALSRGGQMRRPAGPAHTAGIIHLIY
ncbi:MAG: hypothetical protein ABJX82_18555 [Paracoccaceae bacterium]